MSLTWIVLLLLAFGAWRDLMTRTIPDFVSVAILVLGLVVRATEGAEAVGWSLLTAIGLFLALLPLNARGFMGGADLKLLAALAAGLSPLESYRLISAVALLGALLAIIYLGLRPMAVRRAPRTTVRPEHFVDRFLAVESWRIRRGAALPYGVAIAAGAAVLTLGATGV